MLCAVFYCSLQKYSLRFWFFIPCSPNTLAHLNSYVRGGGVGSVKFSFKQVIVLGEELPKKIKDLVFLFFIFVVSVRSFFSHIFNRED